MRLFVAFLCIALTHAAGAQVACPWITQGTAEVALGAPARLIVTVAPNPVEGSCVFTSASDHAVLEIVVSSVPQKECPANSGKLAGIGNEAHSCQQKQTSGAVRLSVESRVRSLYFRVSLTASLGASKQGLEQQSKRVEVMLNKLPEISSESLRN